MKRGFSDNDFVSGNEYFHVTKSGDVLKGKFERVRGQNYISNEHSCSCGKDTYDTYEDAKKALNLRSNRKKEIYKCSICGHWHLTSKDGYNRKPKKVNNKKNRNQPITFTDESVKATQKYLKKVKNTSTFYHPVKEPKRQPPTQKVKLGELCDLRELFKENKCL